jgi:hypothetical protein
LKSSYKSFFDALDHDWVRWWAILVF